jgi:flagellar protein FlbD
MFNRSPAFDSMRKKMVDLTKLNGDKFYLNPHLIEKMEEKPDTVITMSSQVQYIVKDKIEDILVKIVRYRKRLVPNSQE